MESNRKFNGERYVIGNFEFGDKGSRTWIMDRDCFYTRWNSKLWEGRYKGKRVAIRKIEGRTKMVFEFDFLKAIGGKGSEEQFLRSGLNKFPSFTMQGEFGDVRRFYIGEYYYVNEFMKLNGSKEIENFSKWFWNGEVPRVFRYSGIDLSQLETVCTGFFKYVKNLCENK